MCGIVLNVAEIQHRDTKTAAEKKRLTKARRHDNISNCDATEPR